MIVGGYELHLYCRNSGMLSFATAKPIKRPGCLGRTASVYGGGNFTEAKRHARKDGWKFEGRDVLCPGCVKAEKEARRG